MNNLKTNPTKNGQETVKEVVALAVNAENSTSTEQIETPALKVVGRKSTSEVFEKLDTANGMRTDFLAFKAKVEICENFRKNYNNEALLLTVQNLGTGAEIQVQSIPMILEFVEDKVIKAGVAHLKSLEDGILKFAL